MKKPIEQKYVEINYECTVSLSENETAWNWIRFQQGFAFVLIISLFTHWSIMGTTIYADTFKFKISQKLYRLQIIFRKVGAPVLSLLTTQQAKC